MFDSSYHLRFGHAEYNRRELVQEGGKGQP